MTPSNKSFTYKSLFLYLIVIFTVLLDFKPLKVPQKKQLKSIIPNTIFFSPGNYYENISKVFKIVKGFTVKKRVALLKFYYNTKLTSKNLKVYSLISFLLLTETIKPKYNYYSTTNIRKSVSLFTWAYYIITSILFTYLLFYFFRIKSKHQLEKKLIEDRKKIIEKKLFNVKKNLELKNKKLATSALQAIENEELKKQFVKQLQTEIPCKYHSKLEKLTLSFQKNSKNNWNEFKTHFEQINSDFLDNLKTDYPTLSPSELKLCSFLKLNLRTKDIAILMGISYDSVKMGRYRIRKKLNISRDVNLVTFISKF